MASSMPSMPQPDNRLGARPPVNPSTLRRPWRTGWSTWGRATSFTAPSVVLDGQVLFLACQHGQRVYQIHTCVGRDRQHPVQDIHHGRRKHVDTAKAEIVTGADARYQQALFSFSGCGLFDHRIYAIQVAVRRDAAAADGSVTR